MRKKLTTNFFIESVRALNDISLTENGNYFKQVIK